MEIGDCPINSSQPIQKTIYSRDGNAAPSVIPGHSGITYRQWLIGQIIGASARSIGIFVETSRFTVQDAVEEAINVADAWLAKLEEEARL